MKHNIKSAFALFIALLMAVPTFTLAEEPAGQIVMLGEASSDAAEVAASDLEPAAMETGNASLELPDPDIDLPLDGLIQGDAGEPAPDSVVTYLFIVDLTLFATQEARDGDVILRPEDPAAPKGQVFAGWALEDGTLLFVDADGDGVIEPVIAHPDPLCPEVNVFAQFTAAEAHAEESGEVDQPAAPQPSPDGEGGTAQSAVTEEVPYTEEAATGEATEENPTSSDSADAEPASPEGEASGDVGEEASTAPQPSPDGEGGTAQSAVTDEVLSTVEAATGDATEEEPTSSDSADAEPASPEGEASGDVDEEVSAAPQPSPGGEGGTAQSAVTDEAPYTEEAATGDAATGDAAEEEPTSSDSADAEPASPEGEASGDVDEEVSAAPQPSPDGEGGTAQSAVTDEVPYTEEAATGDAATGDAAEEEPTSSDSADAEPASPEGEASGDVDEEVSAAPQPSPDGEGGTAQSAVTDEVLSTQESTAEAEQPAEAKHPTDEPTEEETPIEEPVEAEGEALQPVSVVFDAMPETAAVTVWPVANGSLSEEAGSPEGETESVIFPDAIPAQEDGSFALLPGEYTYTAEAEGYVTIENAPFTVTGDEQPMMISFEMEAVPEEIPEPVAFDQSKIVNGVVVTVKADPGVFPSGAELSVETVPVYQQQQADTAVDEVRDENQNVAVSYTFDIKVINPVTGEEYQPAEGQKVEVSFALAEVAEKNLETQVYHVTEDETTGELTAESLDVNTETTPETGEATTAVVETDGFSIYTVEFTYNNLEYVLPGDTSVPMSEILTTLGLAGEVTAVEISDSSLFSASNETGEWIVTAHQAFDTTEWMKVTINGLVYEIRVTDDGSGLAAIGYLYYADEAAAIAGNTTTGSCTDYTVVSDQTAWGEAGQTKWYVVNSSVTIADRITVSGDVHLILSDGCTLTASKGIGVTSGNSLTIYGQSVNESTMGAIDAQLGIQSVYNYLAAIGGGGSQNSSGQIIINGGKITAKGGTNAAGIGGGKDESGTVTINDGFITATSQYNNATPGAAIGGGNNGSGTVTINGGHVVATGGQSSAGIGSGYAASATVTINSGIIEAHGGAGAAGIGSGKYWNDTSTTRQATVYIHGGTVTADTKSPMYNTDGSAAIGGGAHSQGFVAIDGGHVTATAPKNCTCIGNYEVNYRQTGSVTITGGVVMARLDSSVQASDTYYGIGGADCSVTLGWTNESDSITAPAWGKQGNNIATQNNGVTFVDGKSFQYQDTHTLAEAASLRNSATLIPFIPAAQENVEQADVSGVRAWYPHTGSPIEPEPVVTYSGTTLVKGTDYTLSYTSDHTNTGSKEVTITGIGNYTGTKTIPYQIVEASTTYLDDTGTSQTCTIFQCLDQSDTALGAGWYLVYDDLTIDDRISLTGDVKLILKNGTTLTAQKGISVPSSASLTIYAQSNSGSTAGKLETGAPDVSYPGIGGPYQANTAVTPGNITIVGGVINVTGGVGAAAIGGATYSPGGNITIKGGVVTAGATVGGGAAIGGGANADGGTITIGGGTVTATGNGGAAIGGGSYGKSGTITISSGTVTATADGCAAIGGGSNGAGETINITGGTITATNSGETGGAAIGGGINAAGGKITIENATIAKATASAGAGIGSGGGETAGTTTVIIGTGAIISNAGSYNGAGIGSGQNSSTSCSVMIQSGANVKAGSTLGAGIGGGNGASNFSVTIQGGTVNAWAGGIGTQDKNGNLSAYGGAAIGGGANTSGGNVSISGGTVTAKAIGGGAGIGSGANTSTSATTDSGTITISGGTVTATATHRAAGIGGGRRSNGGTITISGGTITANGSDAAGIGHGGEDTLWEGQGNLYVPIVTDPTQDVGGAWYDSIVQTSGTNKTTTDGNVTFSYADGGTVSITASSYPSAPTLSKDFMYSDNGVKVVATSITGEKTIIPYSAHLHSFTYSASGATITATCSATSCPLTSSQATLTINAPTELTYDGNDKAAMVTGDTAVLGMSSITYSKAGDTSFTGTPTGAGTYTASITLTGVKTSAGENQSVTASVEYTIAPKSVTITGLAAENKRYDGTATATTTGGAIEGRVGEDDVTVTAGIAAFANANVGTGKTVTFSGYSLSGTAAGNYTLSEQPASVTADITQRPITVTAADQSVELGGNIAQGTEKVNVTSGELVSGHSISAVTLTASSTAAVTTTGTITPSGITIQNGSNNDVTSNYNITPANGTLTVTKVKAQITTAPTTNSKTYNGLAENLLTGGAADTSLEYSTDGTTFAATVPQGTNADTYTVYYRAAADSNHEAGDAVPLIVTISKASLTVTAKPKTITYGDAPTNDGVEYSGFVNGESSTILGGSLDYDYTYSQYGDVGSYTITPKGLTSTNYTITFASGTLIVEKKEVGLKWSTTPLTFTGEAQAPTPTVTGTVNSDEIGVAVTVEGDHTNAGENYTATANALTGDKAGNYKLPATGLTQTFSIGKAAAPTITDVTQSLLYTTTSVSASVSGKMPENAGTLTYTAGSAAATGSVTVSNFTVDASGNVSATISSGAAGDTVTLPVTIGSTNYADSTVNVVITLTAKTDAGVSIDEGTALTKTYGDADFTLTSAATNEGENGGWTWTSGDETIATVTGDTATPTVTILKASSTPVIITAKYESDTTIGEATITLTVNPKSITGATVTLSTAELTYTGSQQSVTVTRVKVGDVTLTASDYDVSGSMTGTNADTYTVTVTGKGNYKDTATATWKITAKPMTVTAEDVTAIYDGQPHGISVTVSDPASGYIIKYGNAAGTYDLDANPTITNVSESPKTVYYQVTADNYETYTGFATVTINKAFLTVTAKPKTITYGDAPANDGVEYSGFVNGEASTVLGGTLAYEYNYTQYGNVGGYTITPKGLTSDNYEISFVPAALTVGQKEAGLTWSGTPLTFNGSAQAPTAAATGTVNGDEISVTVGGAQTDAGTGYTATASALTGDKAGNYRLPDAKTTTFDIGKASHDNESANGSAKYGSSGEVDLSALIVDGGSLGTLSATDGDSILNGTPSATNGKLGFAFANDSAKIGKTATVTVPVASANYADYSIVVTLTVLDKDVPTLTANAVTKTYDGSAVTNAQIGGTAKAGETDVAGTWAFKVGQSLTNVADSGAKTVVFTPTDTANYKSAETTLVLTVNPKSLTGAAVTLSASRITYDGAQKSVTVTGVALGGVTLTAGDDYDVSGALSGTNANTYTVTVTGKGNYSDSATATWTIQKAGASATAPKAATGLTYNGAAQPLVSAGSASGGTIRYSLSANGPFAEAIPTGTNAGDYAVYYKAVGDGNHNDSAVGGPVNVTIGRRTVGLTWANTSFTYDGNSHAPAATATGLVGSDACTVSVSGVQKNAGTHTATATALSDANYALPQDPTRSFTINPATVTVTAQAKSKTYGDADPALTYTAIGLVGDDTLTGALTRASGENVGTYAIQQGTLAASGNYTLTYTGANLTIGKKALTVTAEAKSKTEGEADPALTYKVAGLVGSDQLTGALTRAEGESAGSYDITIGTLSAGGNYDIRFTGAKLTIVAKATPKPTAEPTATPKPTAMPTATPKPTAEPTATPKPTAMPTVTPKPTVKPTATPSPTSKPTAKPTVAPKPTKQPVESDVTLLATMKASGKTGMKLSWTKVKDADGYDVFFGRCGSGDYSLIASVKGSASRSYKVTGLKKATGYKAYVKAWKKVRGVKTYIGKASSAVHAITGGYNRKAANPKTVTVNASRVTLTVGKSSRIRASVKGVKSGRQVLAHVKVLRYYSSNRNVATVSSAGKIRATGVGSCKIYVLANNGVRATVRVTVIDGPTKDAFKKSSYSMKKGKTLKLASEIKLTPSGVTTTYTWASSDPTIATVNSEGVVKGLKKGTTTVTVTTTNGKTAKVMVIVK